MGNAGTRNGLGKQLPPEAVLQLTNSLHHFTVNSDVIPCTECSLLSFASGAKQMRPYVPGVRLAVKMPVRPFARPAMPSTGIAGGGPFIPPVVAHVLKSEMCLPGASFTNTAS